MVSSDSLGGAGRSGARWILSPSHHHAETATAGTIIILTKRDGDGCGWLLKKLSAT